jgi:hypothetical protein
MSTRSRQRLRARVLPWATNFFLLHRKSRVCQSAVELARIHGIYAVSRPLRLDYTRLKKQVSGSSASSASRREGSQPSFVELIGAAGARVDEYVIEFESGQGPKMRIHWKAATPPNWAVLEAWRRAGR